MKKFLALLFVFVLAVSCVACKSSEIDVPREVDMTIRQAYIDAHGLSGEYSEPWELGVRYYGYYDGAYVFDAGNNGMVLPWVTGPYRTRIGDLVFHFSQNQSLDVYKDGEVKGLKDAYKAGWLSDEALADLHKSFDGE